MRLPDEDLDRLLRDGESFRVEMKGDYILESHPVHGSGCDVSPRQEFLATNGRMKTSRT